MSSATFEIKFTFDAEEPQELSVTEGELVRAPGKFQRFVYEQAKGWEEQNQGECNTG